MDIRKNKIVLLVFILLLPVITIFADYENLDSSKKEFWDMMLSREQKYKEYFDIKISRGPATKKEIELMNIAEEYCPDDDLFTTQSLNDTIRKPRFICKKVLDYYVKRCYELYYLEKRFKYLTLDYSIEIDFTVEITIDGIEYKNVFLVSSGISMQYGSIVDNSIHASGFAKQRFVWIDADSKKVLKVIDCALKIST